MNQPPLANDSRSLAYEFMSFDEQAQRMTSQLVKRKSDTSRRSMLFLVAGILLLAVAAAGAVIGVWLKREEWKKRL